MCDYIIKHGTVITMDPARRVIEDGAVAVLGDRILAVGPTREITEAYFAAREIDASQMVIMPGLIDGHAHAGHALVKSLGADLLDSWNEACFKIYQEASDEEFWYADGLLSALERLKCGTTTSVNMLGGGDTIMRTDDPAYGERHCEAIEQIGIREFLAVGPGKTPFPRRYQSWDGSTPREVMVSFEKQMQTSEELIQRWHRRRNDRISICVSSPTIHPGRSFTNDTELEDLKYKANEARALSRKYGVLFTQDGHARGSIQFAHDQLDLLGPDVFLSHNIDLTPEEIEICRQTATNIVHNPSAIMSILGRCPVPELLDSGVTVFLGSDGVAPDRSYDMFRHMFQCMRYHRTYFHDPNVLPPGKVLEMVTIDAARGLGLEKEIGSLEAGKKADILLVDMAKPHLYPLNMPAYRIAYFALGSDVDTVIVDGQILMEKRVVKTVDERSVLDLAQKAAEKAIARAGLEDLTRLPERFWGHSHY
jgi:5-methylthioadenosine/S-adenosylhomocysteine deaminase